MYPQADNLFSRPTRCDADARGTGVSPSSKALPANERTLTRPCGPPPSAAPGHDEPSGGGKTRRRGGYTLAETILAVAITASLLAALAVATHASLLSYGENEKIATVTQAARFVLTRMMDDIRTAAAVETTTSRVSIIPPAGSSETMIVYEYTGGQIRCSRTTAAGTVQEVLLGGGEGVTVDTFAASAEMAQDDEGGWYTTRVVVRLCMNAKDQPFDMTVSAAPRRNQSY